MMSKLVMLLSPLLSLGKGTGGMAKTDSPTTADNDSTKKELDRCKELIIHIRNIPPAPEPRWPGCCIYRVPKRLREVKKKAYTPRLVSIGPFHCCMRKELKDMENQKLIYFSDFCKRTGKSAEDIACEIIMPNEMKIRHCYSENFDHLRSKEFIKIILLDAIFILELFWRKYEKDSGNSEAHDQIDYILSRPCMERGIQHDLLLLENQLPFFVLKELYEYAEPKTKKETLLELSCWFFGDLYHGWEPESKKCINDLVGCFRSPQNPSPSSPEPKNDRVNHITDLVNRFRLDRSSTNFIEVKHFTDLVRYFFCPPKKEGQKSKPKCCTCTGCSQEQEDENKRIKHLHGTATKLDEAGLKFTRPYSKRELLDIQLRPNECLKSFPCFNLSWLLSCLPSLKSTCLVDMQRFLEVPPLWVDDKTEGLFRNLMALEQCRYPSETYVCDYIVLLDDLITTKADVRLLVEKMIIVNELGSSAAVTKLVNNLALEIELERGKSHYHYEDLCDSLNEYSDSIWNRLVGTLTRVYFTDFFKGTATVVGIIVLVLTLWNFSRLLSKV